jgi:hypothetical protein
MTVQEYMDQTWPSTSQPLRSLLKQSCVLAGIGPYSCAFNVSPYYIRPLTEKQLRSTLTTK